MQHSCKTAHVPSTLAYGSQITELKRGTEVVVCTPGRMIDILVTSAGKITNLRRVTYLVGELLLRSLPALRGLQNLSQSLQTLHTRFIHQHKQC